MEHLRNGAQPMCNAVIHQLLLNNPKAKTNLLAFLQTQKCGYRRNHHAFNSPCATFTI